MEPEGDILILLTSPNGTHLVISFGEDQQKAFIQTKDLDAGADEAGGLVADPRLSKFVSRVITRIADRTSALNLEMSWYGRNDLNDPRVLVSRLNLSQASDVHKVRFPGAKYVSFKIEDSSVLNTWKLSEILVEGVVGGYRQ